MLIRRCWIVGMRAGLINQEVETEEAMRSKKSFQGPGKQKNTIFLPLIFFVSSFNIWDRILCKQGSCDWVSSNRLSKSAWANESVPPIQNFCKRSLVSEEGRTNLSLNFSTPSVGMVVEDLGWIVSTVDHKTLSFLIKRETPSKPKKRG